MKKIISTVVVLGILASCKKDDHPKPAEPLKKITSIERIVDGANKSAYEYDNQGRISVIDFSNNYVRTEYVYNTPGFAFRQHNNSGDISWEVNNGVVENGRLVSAMFRNYSNGQFTFERQGVFTYNEAGYLIKMDYPSYYATLEYTNGNCTKILHYNKPSGELNETITLEYYTDKPNKFNVNFFEYANYLPVMCNMGLMGKANASLVKKVTTQNSNNTRVIDYQYTTDAKGYATEYSFSSVLNGGTPYSETYTINY
jgi:hypothetical protein